LVELMARVPLSGVVVVVGEEAVVVVGIDVEACGAGGTATALGGDTAGAVAKDQAAAPAQRTASAVTAAQEHHRLIDTAPRVCRAGQAVTTD
jgi:hypothetical protein